jgi:pimeloyl-ACP methyl ester carboxylesterase
VGHSYGGAVISEAAATVGNVRSLVYLNALALDAGESNLDISDRFPSSIGPALRPLETPAGTDLYIDPASFRAVFAADLPARITDRLASAQRPVSLAALQEKSTEPAWKTIASWYVVGRRDQVITPAAQRFMAKRAGAHTVEIDASHASYLSRPGKVTRVILRAAAR